VRRRAPGGRSFSLQLTASFMACMGVLLAFISISLLTPLSSLLEKNAFERTKETVLQSVSAVNVFIDRLLSTLYFATTALPDSMDGGAEEWTRQMELVKKSDSDLISIALFHRDGTLLGAVGAGDVAIDAAEVAGRRWPGAAPQPIFPAPLCSISSPGSARLSSAWRAPPFTSRTAGSSRAWCSWTYPTPASAAWWRGRRWGKAAMFTCWTAGARSSPIPSCS